MTAPLQIGWDAVNRRRLHRHGLVESLTSIPAAAAAMAGAHAQVMSAAEVSLAIRVEGAARTDVAAALWDQRSLVKTYGPRGTVHLLPTADLPWWTVALGSLPASSGHAPDVRLDQAETDAILAALDAALREGDRTTEELDAYVADHCGEWASRPSMPAFGGFWPRWRQALGVAAARGVLCFGPNHGRRVAYSSPSRWVPGLALPDLAEAQRRLVTAYLTAYGPATPAHLAQWLATSPGWTRQLFERTDLQQVRLDGEPAWVMPGDTDFEAPDPPAVRLLPYFDAFAVGSQPRARVFPGRASARALAGSQAGNFPVLLLDGVVGGVWHQRRAGRKADITVEPLGRLTRQHRTALEVEAERIGAILDARAELVVGPVSVGPHA